MAEVSSRDVIVVGGGAVGVSLACALAGAGLEVTLVEAAPARAQPHSGSADPDEERGTRPLALSLGSRRILEGLGAWDSLRHGVAPIRRIHVSHRGRFAFTRLEATDAGVDAFGYVSTASALEQNLWRLLLAQKSVQVLRPARVATVTMSEERVEVAVEADGEAHRLAGRLLVAADGAGSSVRRKLGVRASARSYEQVAVTAPVTPERPHADTAYERFTERGPLALLPMAGNRCGLIWSVPTRMAEDLLGLDDRAFLHAATRQFGTRLGAFRAAGRRRGYRLQWVRSREQIRGRAVIVGNAAHTLHPVGAQGFNLGLRDVAALAEVVADATRDEGDPGAALALRRYAAWRRGDQRSVAFFTDTLVRLFGQPGKAVALACDLGLLALDAMPSLKAGFARRAMGLAGRQSRLARGLPL